ncbi:MAG: hypothetical protein JHC93_08555 [Parachlamydiales bacterium]|nr:hypothetical protein [Parachlamydiales bacterium]
MAQPITQIGQILMQNLGLNLEQILQKYDPKGPGLQKIENNGKSFDVAQLVPQSGSLIVKAEQVYLLKLHQQCDECFKVNKRHKAFCDYGLFKYQISDGKSLAIIDEKLVHYLIVHPKLVPTDISERVKSLFFDYLTKS